MPKKTLVDVLRHSQQPLDDKQLAALYSEVERVGAMPGIKDMAIYYQIKSGGFIGEGQSRRKQIPQLIVRLI